MSQQTKNLALQGRVLPQEPGSEDPPAATPQGQKEEDPHDIEMRDVEEDPDPPPPLEQDDDPLPVPAAKTNLPPEDNGDPEDMKDSRDMIIEDERIVIETGGATPITPPEDQLLDRPGWYWSQNSPSGVVTELLSQMNMDSLTAPASGE